MIKKVLEIISRIMEVPLEQLNEETTPEEVENWDSLRHINLVLALEEEFNIVISAEEVMEMLNVKIIVEILKKKKYSSSETY